MESRPWEPYNWDDEDLREDPCPRVSEYFRQQLADVAMANSIEVEPDELA